MTVYVTRHPRNQASQRWGAGFRPGDHPQAWARTALGAWIRFRCREWRADRRRARALRPARTVKLP